MGEVVGLLAAVGVEDELHEPGAIAQVYEDQAAMIAPAVHPARDPDIGVDPVRKHLTAPGVAIAVGAQGRKPVGGRAHVASSSTARPRSSSRCPPDSMSRTCALPSS